jgi:hypothetical protein
MRNNFIYGLTDDVMSKLVENGIPQHFLQYILQVLPRKLPSAGNEPRKFSVEDLKFGFFIHMSLCAISLIVFILEVVLKFVRKR